MDVDEACISEDAPPTPNIPVPTMLELQMMVEEIRIRADGDRCRELAVKCGSQVSHLRALSDSTIERLTEQQQLQTECTRQAAAQEFSVTL